MPYLPGYNLVDGLGQSLTDSVGGLLSEAPFNLNDLINDVRDILTAVLVNIPGYGTAALALKQLIEHITGTGPAAPVTMESYVQSIYDFLQPGGSVPTSLHANVDALAANHNLQDVLNAINALPQGEVTLPETPPAGYGGATAAEVWAWDLANLGGPPNISADAALSNLWGIYNLTNRGGTIRATAAPDFLIELNSTIGTTYGTAFVPPSPDYTDILAGETVVDWLNRTDTSGRTWQTDPGSDLAWSDTLAADEYYSAVRCRLHDADLAAIRDGYGGAGAASNVPPIWPGLAGVTLGTPVALAPTVTISETMHGVLVNLSSPPTKTSVWPLGGKFAYGGLGQIAFVSDNGEAEAWQWLQCDDQLYVPLHMAEAAGCILRSPTDAAGTVTPWLLA